MKRKKLTVILLGLLLLFVGVLSGCQLVTTLLDDNYHEQGYVKVTLFYNGGIRDGAYYHERFIPKDARFPYPGGSGSPINSPTRSAHTLDGWYLLNADKYFKDRVVDRVATITDEHGNKVEKKLYYEDGTVVTDIQYYIQDFDYMRGEKAISSAIFEDPDQDVLLGDWNFEIDRVSSDIVLIPLWKSAREYVYIGDDETKLLDPDDDFFKSKTSGGNYQYTSRMRTDGSIRKPDVGRDAGQVPVPTAMQVEGLYLDDRFVNEVPFDQNDFYYPPETYNEDGSIKRFPIYVKYVDEALKIVNSVSDFQQEDNVIVLPTSHEGEDLGYYLRSSFDLEGKELNFRNRTFSQYFYGNNHTISNFVVNISQDSRNPSTSVYGAVFENVSNATISNITFDRFTVNFKRNIGLQFLNTTPIVINTLARDLSSVTLSNVKVTNMTVIDQPALSFKTYSFTGDNKAPEVIQQGEYYIIRVDVAGSPQLQSYEIDNEQSWATRLPLSLGQLGTNFGTSVDRIANSSADNVRQVDWTPDFVRTVNEFNYFTLPDYGVVVSSAGPSYKFHGWYDTSGYRYGSKYIIPQQGEEFVVRPMFYMVG